jgi:putative ABC transport system substrate-binding protein
MRRRDILGLAAGGFAALPLAGHAQDAGKVWRIGHLDSGPEAGRPLMLDRFRRWMADLGYIDGRNLIIQSRFAEGSFERLPELARELVASDPDALLVATTPAATAAKVVATRVPIVIVAVADPVGVGLVQSLARPGANITGVTNIAAELTGKRLEILKEIVPGTRRVAVLFNPDDPNAAVQRQYAEAAAHTLGIELRPFAEIRGAADIEPAIAAAVREGADAAIRMVDPLSMTLAKQTAELATRRRLPLVFPFRGNAEVGGLVAYGTDLTAQFGQAAELMAKILKGARPADLPLEQPTRFELTINLKTAKELGLTVPPALLARADEVIE